MSQYHIISLEGIDGIDEMYQEINAGKEWCERCKKKIKESDKFMLVGYPINKYNFRVHVLCASCGGEIKQWSEKFADKEKSDA